MLKGLNHEARRHYYVLYMLVFLSCCAEICRNIAMTLPPLPEALKDLDYMQLTLHGGHGCFHIDKDGICGRADFWAGHPVFHSFVSLQEAVTKYGQACREAALEEAAKVCDDRANGENDAQHCADRIRSLK